MTQETNRPWLPERVARLSDLAGDLWWSWHPEARAVFRRIDYGIWRTTAHNPERMLRRRLAGRKLRAAELGRRADRAGADPRRQAVHHRGAARRSVGAGRGVVRAAGPRDALPARHQPRGKRAVGPRAVGAPLRRRSR